MPESGAPGGQLTRQAVAGLGWSSLGTIGTVVLRILTLGILARLLTQEDFGLVAAALIAVEFSTLLAESGMGAAVVHAPRMGGREVRVAFTVGVLTAGVACAALMASAGWIQTVMGIDGLAPVIRVIAVTFVIRSLSLGQFLLSRRLAFRRLSLVNLSAYLGQGVIAVTLALSGLGVWSIVYGHIAFSCIKVVLLWVNCPHPITPLLERSTLRALASFGGGVTLGRIVNFIARQGDYVVVGRGLGAASLGLYKQAYQLMAMPAELFGRAVTETLFPAMAKVQGDVARLRRAYSRGAALLALLTLPISMVAATLSRETILLVLGPDWTEAGAAFSVMVFGIFFRTATKLSDALVQATGAVYRSAWRQAVYALLVIVGAVIGSRVGLVGVAVGVLIALVVNFLLMADLSIRLTAMSWRAFAALHVPGCLLAAATGGASWGVATVLARAGAVEVVQWGLAIASSLLAGVILLRLSPRLPAMRSLSTAVADLHGMLPPRARGLLARVIGSPAVPTSRIR